MFFTLWYELGVSLTWENLGQRIVTFGMGIVIFFIVLWGLRVAFYIYVVFAFWLVIWWGDFSMSWGYINHGQLGPQLSNRSSLLSGKIPYWPPWEYLNPRGDINSNYNWEEAYLVSLLQKSIDRCFQTDKWSFHPLLRKPTISSQLSTYSPSTKGSPQLPCTRDGFLEVGERLVSYQEWLHLPSYKYMDRGNKKMYARNLIWQYLSSVNTNLGIGCLPRDHHPPHFVF